MYIFLCGFGGRKKLYICWENEIKVSFNFITNFWTKTFQYYYNNINIHKNIYIILKCCFFHLNRITIFRYKSYSAEIYTIIMKFSSYIELIRMEATFISFLFLMLFINTSAQNTSKSFINSKNRIHVCILKR